MPTCLNKASIPNVLASSGTIGTILLPISLSFSKSVITLTAAIVVEIFLSSEPEYNLVNALLSGIGRISDFVLLLGIGPPNFALVFFRYCISGEFSGGLT